MHEDGAGGDRMEVDELAEFADDMGANFGPEAGQDDPEGHAVPDSAVEEGAESEDDMGLNCDSDPEGHAGPDSVVEEGAESEDGMGLNGGSEAEQGGPPSAEGHVARDAAPTRCAM